MSLAFKSPFREFFTVVVAIQGVHVSEHIAQLFQVYVFHVEEDHALGLLGYIFAFHGTEEYLHFVFNVTYALCLYIILFNLRPFVPTVVPHRAFMIFLILGVGLESWHVVEHTVIITHVIQNNGCPCLGIVDSVTGLTDTILHFVYNGIAYGATLVPFAYLMRQPNPEYATAA